MAPKEKKHRSCRINKFAPTHTYSSITNRVLLQLFLLLASPFFLRASVQHCESVTLQLENFMKTWTVVPPCGRARCRDHWSLGDGSVDGRDLCRTATAMFAPRTDEASTATVPKKRQWQCYGSGWCWPRPRPSSCSSVELGWSERACSSKL
jgi:hypothetical protein